MIIRAEKGRSQNAKKTKRGKQVSLQSKSNLRQIFPQPFCTRVFLRAVMRRGFCNLEVFLCISILWYYYYYKPNIGFPIFFGTFVLYPPLWDPLYWISYVFRDICCVSLIVGPTTKYWISCVFLIFVVYSHLLGPLQSIDFPMFLWTFAMYFLIVARLPGIAFPLFLETFLVCFPIVGPCKSIEHCLTCGWRVG